MKRLSHYKNTSMTKLRELIRGEVKFSVLYDILGGDCNDIFTDGEEIIICYSEAPYPVWIWCCNAMSIANLAAIGECIKENFPLSEYNIILDREIISGLAEVDSYFTNYNVNTEIFAYRLDEICDTVRNADGQIESAEICDIEVLANMWKAAAMEMERYDFPIEQCRNEVNYMIDDERLYVWKNGKGEIAAMANKGCIGEFGKVSAVYTVPKYRRLGYATSLVGEITRMIIREGLVPALYTDGGYSASNECYKKIGYRQVGKLFMINKR
jgi:GNAT superfamily N-acetyltransferase